MLQKNAKLSALDKFWNTEKIFIRRFLERRGMKLIQGWSIHVENHKVLRIKIAIILTRKQARKKNYHSRKSPSLFSGKKGKKTPQLKNPTPLPHHLKPRWFWILVRLSMVKGTHRTWVMLGHSLSHPIKRETDLFSITNY